MLRFASSPTHDMNIGDLRVAIYNYIVAKQRSEDLIVRIEDTNKDKNVEGKDQEILDLLALFGIEYSQIIYQSESVRFHTAMALQLMHEKKAFSCFCSDNWIDKKREEAKQDNNPYMYDDACRNLPDELVIDNMSPFCIRIKKPDDSKDLDSFVIMSQEKKPMYDFSCAVDDMLNDISIVICDEDKAKSTSKQELVRSSLSYDKKIEYVYLPTIDDTTSIKSLLEDGFLPAAIINYIVNIGRKESRAILSMNEAIELFDISKLSNAPVSFDISMLRDINKEHLKALDAKELSRYVGFADEEIGKLARVYLEEVSTTKELKSKIEPIFATKSIPGELKASADILSKTIKNAPYFKEYGDFEKYIVNESALKGESLSKPLRVLLTGNENGPDISVIYEYIKNYIGEIVK
ncbi:glutamate--tRNA ligase family protein [Sulfurimonas sp.]|nr:glutamate--tRNA ligase family protein [Sulfurimonas sp.]